MVTNASDGLTPSARAQDGADLALSLPTATHGIPLVAPALASLGSVHALVLSADVEAGDVEALALSGDEHAGWVGASRLQLLPQVELHGPFPLPSALRETFALPAWAAQVMTVSAPVVRSGPLPPALAGLNPVADAFPLAQPEGVELLALTRLAAIARRLAGGLLLAGDGEELGGAPRPVLVVPDPASAVNLSVYAPVWLSPEACQSVLAGLLPGVEAQLGVVGRESVPGADVATMPVEELERLERELGAEELDRAWRLARERELDPADAVERTGYGLSAPVSGQREAWGTVEVQVGPAEVVPVAVSGQEWAHGGGVLYALSWMPRDLQALSGEPGRVALAERERATALIEAAARSLAAAAAGVVVDEDGFLVVL